MQGVYFLQQISSRQFERGHRAVPLLPDAAGMQVEGKEPANQALRLTLVRGCHSQITNMSLACGQKKEPREYHIYKYLLFGRHDVQDHHPSHVGAVMYAQALCERSGVQTVTS